MNGIDTRERLAAALARVALRDQKALEAVYRATSAKLFGVCLRVLGDRGEAEDVLQEVYLTVWNKAAAFEAERASPITWMVAIARNRAIDRARASTVARRSDPIEAAAEVPDPTTPVSVRLESADEHRRLQACLDGLDPQQATAIRTAFLEGVTYEQLAERMSVPLGTMKSWIRRGLMKLKACLEQ